MTVPEPELIGNKSAVDAAASTELWQNRAQTTSSSNAAPWDGRVPRSWRTRLSLHRRISLFVGSGLLLCLITFGALGVQAVNEATDRELQQRLLIARTAAGQIDRTLSATLRAFEVVAATTGLDPSKARPEAPPASLHTLRAQVDLSTDHLKLLGPDGTVVAAEPYDPSLVGQNLMPDPSVAQVYASGKSAVSGLRGDASGRPIVLLTAPIRDTQGRVVGALSGDFDLSDPRLLGFLQPVQLGATGNVQVVDDQGNVLGSFNRPDQPVDLSLQATHRSRFAELMRRGVPTVGICHDCHVGASGTERTQDIIAFAPLANAPWGLVVRQSADEAFAPARDLRWRMVAFGIFLLFGGLILAQYTTRGVVKPIEELTRSAQRIAKGDLTSPVPVVGHSEIAVLADAFDEMRERLRRSLDEIERWNESLEQRVLQRTRELSSLLQSANTLASTLDLDTLLDFIVARAGETFKAANAGALFLYERSQDQLVVRSSIGYQPALVRRMRLQPGESIAGKVFATGRELLCATAAEVEGARTDLSPANRRYLELATADLTTGASCMCAPLVTKSRPIGCLFLISPESGAFAESDLRLLRAMADQAAVAVESAKLYEEVRRSEEVRGELLAKLIGAQEEERRRIARELHDETSQALTALVMSLAQLRKVTPSSLHPVHEGIDEIESLAGLTLDEIHRLVYDLRPTLLDDLGLVPAIQWYLETHSQKAGIEMSLELEGLEERLPPQVETVLFRIIQEAITNIIRHAEASTATVRLSRRNGAVLAVIEDDGKGFDVRSVTRRRGQPGLGIPGMKERVNLLGGKLSIVSRLGRGTKLNVEVPVAARDRGNDPSAAS